MLLNRVCLLHFISIIALIIRINGLLILHVFCLLLTCRLVPLSWAFSVVFITIIWLLVILLHLTVLSLLIVL